LNNNQNNNTNENITDVTNATVLVGMFEECLFILVEESLFIMTGRDTTDETTCLIVLFNHKQLSEHSTVRVTFPGNAFERHISTVVHCFKAKIFMSCLDNPRSLSYDVEGSQVAHPLVLFQSWSII
jgi:hypothetical protein